MNRGLDRDSNTGFDFLFGDVGCCWLRCGSKSEAIYHRVIYSSTCKDSESL